MVSLKVILLLHYVFRFELSTDDTLIYRYFKQISLFWQQLFINKTKKTVIELLFVSLLKLFLVWNNYVILIMQINYEFTLLPFDRLSHSNVKEIKLKLLQIVLA